MYFTRNTAKRLKINNEIRDRLDENGYMATMVARPDGGWTLYDPIDHEKEFDRNVEDFTNDELNKFSEAKRNMKREMYLDVDRLEKLYPVVFMGSDMRERMIIAKTRLESKKLTWIYKGMHARGVGFIVAGQQVPID